jgi:hypothetical protein
LTLDASKNLVEHLRWTNFGGQNTVDKSNTYSLICPCGGRQAKKDGILEKKNLWEVEVKVK